MTTINDTTVPAKPPRRRAMLWEELGGKREPEWNKVYMIMGPDGLALASLFKIEQTSNGKKYMFHAEVVGVDRDLNSLTVDCYYSDVTHFCEPLHP